VGGRPAGRSSKVGILAAVAVVVVLLLGIGGYAITQLTKDDPAGNTSTDGGGTTGTGETTGTDDGSGSGDGSGSDNAGAGERPTADFYHDDADWSTTAEEHNNHIGKTAAYKCPVKGDPHTVYGSGPFTSDSSVCTAAVHAGYITLADGGWVTIQMQPGVDSYEGTSQQGITTKGWGAYEWAFTIGG
jgi:hypothetical protein